MKKKGSEIGEWKAFYCDSHDKAGVKCKKKIRYARKYNHFDEELRPIIRVESKGNHEANCDFRKNAKEKAKKLTMKDVVQKNYDRSADKIVELFNEDMGQQGYEEEKIDTKNINQLEKTKNNVY